MRFPSANGDALTKRFEKLRLQTYDDHTGKVIVLNRPYSGVPTIGWGNTRRALPPRKITTAEAESYYAEDRRETVETIHRYVPGRVIDDLPEDCYDALFSFVFNTGPQVFVNDRGKRTLFLATLLSNRNAVPAQMRRWVYDNGKKVQGLINRREVEAERWMRGLRMEQPVEVSAPHKQRIVPDPPKPAISEGPLIEQPRVGAVTSGAGATGAAMTESAQQMAILSDGMGMIVKLLFVLIALAGIGLTIYAIVQQNKRGRA